MIGSGRTVGWSRLKVALVVVASLASLGASPPIRLNTIGYLPDASKQASVAVESKTFTVVRESDRAVVLRGELTGPKKNVDTNEMLYTADFSAVREPGKYHLEVDGVGRSAVFEVGPAVYRDAFVTVTRGMYLWRCGMAVSGTYKGSTYAYDACHLTDAFLDFVGGGHKHVDATGGWHDAGDYNKYVVNAGITVGTMFRAWEDFGPAIQKVGLNLPEAGGKMPEFLSELKWEVLWLLKTQAPDGSVYHKVTTKGFGGFFLPDKEQTERYFTPWGSAATADFVAMTAQAARLFRDFDPELSKRCLAAAQKSAQFLKEHPEEHRPNLEGFTTGGYDTGDADDRLWAAAELWEATGSADALNDFETRARKLGSKLETNWDWDDVRILGVLTYLHSGQPGKDEALVKSLKAGLIQAANSILSERDAHGYARPLGTYYSWGCNGTVARQVVILEAARRFEPKAAYRDASLDALNHLFGRNAFGRSFVTGLGDQPPMHPHDRRSGGDKVADPWPGYLIGGGWPTPLDWRDDEGDYRTNEIAINWNAALIYALAAYLEKN